MDNQRRRLHDNLYLPEGGLLGTEQNIMYLSSIRMLERAMRRGVILEAVVKVCDCTDMTLHVDLGFADGLIPKEEAMYSPDKSKDIAVITRVGKPVCFKVKNILATPPRSRPTVLLSRRDAQRECAANYISHLTPGDIIPAAVTHLDPFGAFVDIGCGIVSLICVDCISVSRIFHPSDRLTPGQRIHAVVKSIDGDTGRIYMSLRELLGTWEENAATFSPCSTVAGVVRSVEDYGVFVELSPNLAGLAELRDGVRAGDSCSVFIKNIIPERMKVKLVIIDSRFAPRRQELRYFVDVGSVRHMSYWRYSPQCCQKVVETRFDS